MHDPPAPVFGDRQVGVAVVEEPGTEQQCDAGRREQQQDQEVFVGTRFADGGHQTTHHQDQPDQQTGEDQELPKAPHIEELVALMPKPVDQRGIGYLSGQGEPLTGERAQNGDHQRRPQGIHTQSLQGGLGPGDQWRQIQSRAEPGRRNPQHRELHMPRASQRIGRDLRQGNAIEVMALDGIMRGHCAESYLQSKQNGDDPDVFGHAPHRGGRLDGRHRIGARIARQRLDILLPFVAFAQKEPAQRTDGGDQQNHRHERPNERRACRLVADQRLVRPIVRVGNGIVRPQRGRGP